VHHALLGALREAQQAGVRVLRSTRCANGVIVAQPADALPASELSPVKARVAMLLELLGP
jgi:L-asparaginase